MKRVVVSSSLAAAVFVLGCTMACDRYRPALFADRPVVTRASDDQPIPVPSRKTFDERVQVSDIYLRRPLFDLVHPLDFPSAGDINALDEVPASSWYDPDGSVRKGFPKEPSPAPSLPFSVVDEKPLTSDAALVVRDAAGVRYELLADPPGQDGLFTGAEVLGGYLLRSLGLNSPMAFIVLVRASELHASDGDDVAQERLRRWLKGQGVWQGVGRRVSATRFPDGIEVGITTDFSVRSDDANDQVDHNDRRTLRAMKVFAQWIGWKSFGVRHTRDVYVGKPDEGHVVHYVVGTSRAFGTSELRDRPVRDEGGGSLGFNLVTLGLSSPIVRHERDSAYPSLGYFPSSLEPGNFDVSPPYSPFVRLQPADEYWATKRLLGTEPAILAGVAAARLPERAARHLVQALKQRRQLLIAHGLTVVTPLDAAGVSGHVVLLRDRAITEHFAVPLDTRYEVRFLDTEGRELGRRARLDAVGAITGFRLPDGVTGQVVVQVTVVRAGRAAARACEVHVQVRGSETRIVGVRH